MFRRLTSYFKTFHPVRFLFYWCRVAKEWALLTWKFSLINIVLALAVAILPNIYQFLQGQVTWPALQDYIIAALVVYGIFFSIVAIINFFRAPFRLDDAKQLKLDEQTERADAFEADREPRLEFVFGDKEPFKSLEHYKLQMREHPTYYHVVRVGVVNRGHSFAYYVYVTLEGLPGFESFAAQGLYQQDQFGAVSRLSLSIPPGNEYAPVMIDVAIYKAKLREADQSSRSIYWRYSRPSPQIPAGDSKQRYECWLVLYGDTQPLRKRIAVWVDEKTDQLNLEPLGNDEIEIDFMPYLEAV